MNTSTLKLAAAITLLLASPSLSIAQDEAAHLATLNNPEGTLVQKQDACRALALVGTAQSVPVLASLLDDAKLSHMARYALEPIPDPTVDTALRNALGTVTGSPRLGVIGSIGVRGDELAIPALTELLKAPDSAVAHASARALGEIGTLKASKALRSALPRNDASQFKAASEGLLRCAESLAGHQQNAEALEIYELLWEFPKAPHQVRTAALRGAVLVQGNDGLPKLKAALNGEDDAMFASAIRVSMELRGPKVVPMLTATVDKLPPERQAMVVRVLGQRGDITAAPSLMTLLDTAATPVRIETVRALTRLGHAPAVPVLATLSLKPKGELTAAARMGLARFPDKAADAAITEFLKNPDAAVRSLGTDLIGQRGLNVAVPALLDVAARDQEESVCVSALKALRDLAGTDELPALLEILLQTKSRTVTRSVTHALVALCARQPRTGDAPSPACVDPLIAALQKSSGPSQAALVEILNRVGGPKAIEAVRTATGKNDQ